MDPEAEALGRRLLEDRRRQGIPDRITDPLTLDKLAVLFRPQGGKAAGRADGPPRRRRSRAARGQPGTSP